MAIKIEQINNEEIKITTETELDLTFWTNIKAQLHTKDIEIDSLKKSLKIAQQELSYLKKENK